MVEAEKQKDIASDVAAKSGDTGNSWCKWYSNNDVFEAATSKSRGPVGANPAPEVEKQKNWYTNGEVYNAEAPQSLSPIGANLAAEVGKQKGCYSNRDVVAFISTSK